MGDGLRMGIALQPVVRIVEPVGEDVCVASLPAVTLDQQPLPSCLTCGDGRCLRITPMIVGAIRRRPSRSDRRARGEAIGRRRRHSRTPRLAIAAIDAHTGLTASRAAT
jgi:hypothetical protein